MSVTPVIKTCFFIPWFLPNYQSPKYLMSCAGGRQNKLSVLTVPERKFGVDIHIITSPSISYTWAQCPFLCLPLWQDIGPQELYSLSDIRKQLLFSIFSFLFQMWTMKRSIEGRRINLHWILNKVCSKSIGTDSTFPHNFVNFNPWLGNPPIPLLII